MAMEYKYTSVPNRWWWQAEGKGPISQPEKKKKKQKDKPKYKVREKVAEVLKGLYTTPKKSKAVVAAGQPSISS